MKHTVCRHQQFGFERRNFVVVSMALLDGIYLLLHVMRTYDAPPLRPERDPPLHVPHLDLDNRGGTAVTSQRKRKAASMEASAQGAECTIIIREYE